MGFGVFSLYYKSAVMLKAREGLATIQQTNFHAFKKENQTKILRFLKQASDQYLKRDVKDYRDVMKNLALSLMRRK